MSRAARSTYEWRQPRYHTHRNVKVWSKTEGRYIDKTETIRPQYRHYDDWYVNQQKRQSLREERLARAENKKFELGLKHQAYWRQAVVRSSGINRQTWLTLERKKQAAKERLAKFRSTPRGQAYMRDEKLWRNRNIWAHRRSEARTRRQNVWNRKQVALRASRKPAYEFVSVKPYGPINKPKPAYTWRK